MMILVNDIATRAPLKGLVDVAKMPNNPTIIEAAVSREISASNESSLCSIEVQAAQLFDAIVKVPTIF